MDITQNKVAAMQPNSALQQFTNALANASLQNNSGIYDATGGQGPIQMAIVPATLAYTAKSPAQTGAETTTVYIFNEDSYNSSPENNGGAAASVYTYADGFNSKFYNNLFKMGNGVQVYGFNISYTFIDGGGQDSQALDVAEFTFLTYNGYGKMVPVTIDLGQAKRNTQYISGLLTVKWGAFINSLCQFSLSLPAGDKVGVTWFTKPIAGM